ncbi:MAG: Na+/H+ antiporter NhaC family protein [Verrucomicrobiia bacterium]
MKLLAALSLIPITWAWLASGSPWAALWPSIAALAAVLLTRRVISGLWLGAFCGALLLAHGNPLTAALDLPLRYAIPALTDRWNVCVILFTLSMGGFVALLEAAGGMAALADRLTRLSAHPRRSAETGAALLGLACFYDGLANSVLVGRIMRPIADRNGVPRLRLAYLVDSLSSPVACLAFVSTWIAYQLSMIQKGYEQAGLTANPYEVFLHSIPFNFYCWFALGLVALVIWRQWNLGPLRQALPTPTPPDLSSPATPPPFLLTRAILPVLLLASALILGLFFSGRQPDDPLNAQTIARAFGQAPADLVMVVACLSASALAAILLPCRPGQPPAGDIFVQGMTNLFPPVLILIAAWSLSATLKELGAAAVLADLVSHHLPIALLPLTIFLLGAAIAFGTGTSWGTMGILMPLALPVALTTGQADPTLITATVGAVFSGAVFGDHASPLSDTTIVSAAACGVDPLDHVKTQLPYALLAAAAAATLGFLPVGFGLTPWAALFLGLSSLGTLSWTATRPAQHQRNRRSTSSSGGSPSRS